MMAPFYGQDLLGGAHRGYEPIDDWNKLCNNKGEGLLIGVEQFDSVPDSGASFVGHVPCMEMQAGLSFMVSVQLLFSLLCVTCLTPAFQLLNVLESIEVNADNSVIQDSLMFKIKQSSAPDHETSKVSHQSLARPNRHFCQFVIDYVSMALYFDCWYPFLSNTSPAPYRKVSCMILFCVNHTVYINVYTIFYLSE
jgi:hypothetical protein